MLCCVSHDPAPLVLAHVSCFFVGGRIYSAVVIAAVGTASVLAVDDEAEARLDR